MIGYVVLAILWGILLGYGIAYTRFWNVKLIEELRRNYKKLQEDVEVYTSQMQELRQQNTVLKQKAQELLDQNEDFAKMVSELSRYYYHIKQANTKLKELGDVLWGYDAGLEKKLAQIDKVPGQMETKDMLSSGPKKFF